MSAFQNVAPVCARLAPPSQSPTAGVTPAYDSEWIDAAAMAPATTNGPAAEKLELAGGTNVDRLLFDGATQETAYVKWIFDESWDRGKIRVRLVWDAATGGSGGVVWGIAARAAGNEEPLDASFANDETLTDTVVAVGRNHTTGTAEVTVSGNPQEGDLVVLRIRRVPSATGDTMSQDAALLGAHIQWRNSRDAQVWT